MAVVVSILKYFKIPHTSYANIQDELDTTVATGTTPENLSKTLRDNNLLVSKGFGDVGAILLNVEKLPNHKYEIKDGQNGHWCFYKKSGNKISVYDVWDDKSTEYSINKLRTISKNVKVKNKRYNQYIITAEKL